MQNYAFYGVRTDFLRIFAKWINAYCMEKDDVTYNNMYVGEMRFCPMCGGERFEVAGAKSRRCARCGFELFTNASAANAAFIVNGRGEVLVTRRKNDPARGTLDLPGGFYDPGETMEEGLRREIREETGLEIGAAEYLFSLPNVYVFSGIHVPTLDIFFLCRVEDGVEITAMDDAAEAFWVPVAALEPADFGLESIREPVRRFRKERANGAETGAVRGRNTRPLSPDP